ncbi:MFS transporter [Anaerosacchariphilus polymeriproducens]|uniref:MFS transporter n=1 Tax=Anaerosacchariphilus polymeriproducens TaxID=1812858 RepID=A0A371AWZ6_9FIRM|nr:MFS transporter [Anaerosacchariphilus polymeriproducens]RDU24032.1 MFS transporter [Anaerosacchariphilus polymeriproducens]
MKRNFNFIIFIITNIISSLGDYIYDIGIIIYLYKITGSSIVIGGYFIFQFIPSLFFVPIIGTLIDKINNKFILFTSNIIRAVILIILLFNISKIPIFLASIILGINDELNRATNNTILPKIINTDEITKANSFLSVSDSITMIIGPIIATLLLNGFGIKGSIVINSISFIIAAILVLTLKVHKNISIVIKNNFYKEVKLGIKFIFTDLFIRKIIYIWGLLLMGVGISSSLIIVFISKNMNLRPDMYGWITAAEGVGIIISSSIIIKKKFIDTKKLIKYGLLILGVGTLCVSLTSNQYILLSSYVLIGIGAGSAPNGIRSMIQKNVEQTMLGRVFTSVRFIVTNLRTLSITIFSILAENLNLRIIFIIAAIFIFLACFISNHLIIESAKEK